MSLVSVSRRQLALLCIGTAVSGWQFCPVERADAGEAAEPAHAGEAIGVLAGPPTWREKESSTVAAIERHMLAPENRGVSPVALAKALGIDIPDSEIGAALLATDDMSVESDVAYENAVAFVGLARAHVASRPVEEWTPFDAIVGFHMALTASFIDFFVAFRDSDDFVPSAPARCDWLDDAMKVREKQGVQGRVGRAYELEALGPGWDAHNAFRAQELAHEILLDPEASMMEIAAAIAVLRWHEVRHDGRLVGSSVELEALIAAWLDEPSRPESVGVALLRELLLSRDGRPTRARPACTVLASSPGADVLRGLISLPDCNEGHLREHAIYRACSREEDRSFYQGLEAACLNTTTTP